MKIYIVVGTIDYEDSSNLDAYFKFEDAEKSAEEYKEEYRGLFDSVWIDEMEVCYGNRVKPLAGLVTGSSSDTDYGKPTGTLIQIKDNKNFINLDEIHEHIDEKKFDAIRNFHKVKR